jgi:hypothetical protein
VIAGLLLGDRDPHAADLVSQADMTRMGQRSGMCARAGQSDAPQTQATASTIATVAAKSMMRVRRVMFWLPRDQPRYRPKSFRNRWDMRLGAI